MATKLAYVLAAYCLFYIIINVDASIVKPNNIPRIGRSDESAGPFEQEVNGYVIKTNKNIPRMGRRNYDSVHRYDIPKYYEMPRENLDTYKEDGPLEFGLSPEEAYFADRFNMKK